MKKMTFFMRNIDNQMHPKYFIKYGNCDKLIEK